MVARRLFPAAFILFFASRLFSAVAGGEIYLASVGRGPGACVSGVCSQWRTSVWITNPSATATATVEVAFLARGQANTNPHTVSMTLAPNESREMADLFADVLKLDGVFGALRIRSNIPVAAHGRIFDANVPTSKGTGSAGQDIPGVLYDAAIAAGQSGEIAGLADTAGLTRTNFAIVEVQGKAASVRADLLDASGAIIGTKSYSMLPFEPMQDSIAALGGAPGGNRRVRLTVSGEGAVVGLGSRIDNITGDPTTIDMSAFARPSLSQWAGTWTGTWTNTTFGSTGGATLVIAIGSDNRTATLTMTLTGNVFGGIAPPPQTITGTILPSGITISQQSPLFGTLTATIRPDGLITASGQNPTSAITQLTAFGYATPQKITLAYFLQFAASAGGSQAGGYVTLTKQ